MISFSAHHSSVLADFLEHKSFPNKTITMPSTDPALKSDNFRNAAHTPSPGTVATCSKSGPTGWTESFPHKNESPTSAKRGRDDAEGSAWHVAEKTGKRGGGKRLGARGCMSDMSKHADPTWRPLRSCDAKTRGHKGLAEPGRRPVRATQKHRGAKV